MSMRLKLLKLRSKSQVRILSQKMHAFSETRFYILSGPIAAVLGEERLLQHAVLNLGSQVRTEMEMRSVMAQSEAEVSPAESTRLRPQFVRAREVPDTQEVALIVEEFMFSFLRGIIRGHHKPLAFESRGKDSDFVFSTAELGFLCLTGTSSRTQLRATSRRCSIFWCVLSRIFKLVQSRSFRSVRDVYYMDTDLYGTQASVNAAVDDIGCALRLTRDSLHLVSLLVWTQILALILEPPSVLGEQWPNGRPIPV